MKTISIQLFILCIVTTSMFAQQVVIEDNSSAMPDENPQLLLLEVNDNGSQDNQDGWSRMWFKNSSDAINRWGFLARPHTGAVDNQGVIASPLVMAYTGEQKFGFGNDGNLVINKSFILPNQAGNQGQALVTTGQTIGSNSTSVVDWGYIDYTEKNATATNPNLEIHEDSDDSAFLNFTNNDTDNIPGFRTRWFFGADPGSANPTSTTGEMRIGWANGAVGGTKNIMTLNADNESVIFSGAGDFNGTVRASCGLLTCSDVRYKENITNISDALSKITKLNGVYFDLRNEDFPDMNFSNDKQIGVVAQDMEAQFPELVKEREDGYKMVAYDRIAPILIEAIKEQQDMIEKLQADNKVLNSKVDMLFSRQ